MGFCNSLKHPDLILLSRKSIFMSLDLLEEPRMLPKQVEIFHGKICMYSLLLDLKLVIGHR